MNDYNDSNFIKWVHKCMGRVPGWLFSIICMTAILYLTLSTDPLGEEKIPLFPGADKLAHALMFAGLTLCLLFDYMRSHGWARLRLPVISMMSMLGMSVGIAIEYLQKWMALGRGFETADMAADAAGAILAGVFWMFAVGILELTDAERRGMAGKSGSAMKGSSELREK